ncbi:MULTISPECIES: ABC transporter ATP-binding protein [unclassified Lactococcus]|uniref:ABC transporter ATP-binding protein n=1 Tax=unclassified Lactococcus TaxID=2643510 RepID=UPI0011CBD225|nr:MULTISPECIES: ABC transporter ATP-binding protein [unclassified Lactococcus]MQW23702.1 ATP-binding cassette domain-containing protein [Lactococcus sp. dk101]TXK37534.1 ABC transporter ATP-binding protein [Lactococcus sp. dk310]TXK48948.1 ABC transporter ATP-binding protein [Lactococcus sp. dk322]
MYFGAKDLCVYYDKKLALEHASFEIEKGKTTAIVGINGSGKSTILRAMGRLLKYKGDIFYDEKPLSALTNLEIAQKIALLPQSALAPSDISVYELVSMGRFPHQKRLQQGLSKVDRQVIEQVMRETDIWEMRDERVAELSGGQRQRVFITMILAQDSDIILLDEPTTYLDLVHQLDILSLLKAFVDKFGKTVVYVIHDLNHAARFADNLILVKDGKIVDTGTVEQLFTTEQLRNCFGLEVTLGCDTYTKSLMITGVKNA